MRLAAAASGTFALLPLPGVGDGDDGGASGADIDGGILGCANGVGIADVGAGFGETFPAPAGGVSDTGGSRVGGFSPETGVVAGAGDDGEAGDVIGAKLDEGGEDGADGGGVVSGAASGAADPIGAAPIGTGEGDVGLPTGSILPSDDGGNG